MVQTSVPQNPDAALKFWQSQRDYYSKRAKQNKRWHDISQITIIVGGALTPVLVTSEAIPKILPLITSLIVTIAAGLDNYEDFGQTWLSYRQATEALRIERMLFESRSGRYKKTDDPVNLFALRCAKICGEELPEFVRRRSSNRSDEKTQNLSHADKQDVA